MDDGKGGGVPFTNGRRKEGESVSLFFGGGEGGGQRPESIQLPQSVMNDFCHRHWNSPGKKKKDLVQIIMNQLAAELKKISTLTSGRREGGGGIRSALSSSS